MIQRPGRPAPVVVTGERLTVGIVTPHLAPGPEVELPAMTSGRAATVLVRTGSAPAPTQGPTRAAPAHAGLRYSTGLAAIEHAAATVGNTTIAAVAHASTTAGYVIGHRDEAVLLRRLAQTFGVPAATTCAAVVTALQTHGVERVQVVHPPWFDKDLDELGVAYFQGQGFDAVVTRAPGLPGDPARAEPRHVLDWAEQHVEQRAQAVFFAGNGFRAAAAVAELELRMGRLVLAANQALLWAILTATGIRWVVPGYGRLLRSWN